MHNELTDNPTIIKSCATCEHRTFIGWCNRTGIYCETEMKHGRMCNKNEELTLWTQQLGIFPRMYRFFFGG